MTEASNNNTSNGLAPYLSKLGLHTEPFSQDIQDEFFFLDPQRSQRLNMLYHLAQNSELLLVVTGENGIGKTSLLQHFIDMGDEAWRSCVIDANSMMNPEQLLIQIAEGFGLPQDSVNFGTGIEMLKKRLVDMKRSELVSILIVDDAHELPAASLTMLMKLSELSDGNEGLLRIVLFSEPQLIEILDSAALKDVRYRVTHSLEIPALNEQDTVSYLAHRLAVAGLKDAVAFSKSELKKIYRLSAGIPGKINLHAHEILLGHQPQMKNPRTTDASKRLRSSFSVLLILTLTVGITWFFTRDALDKLSLHLEEPVNTVHDAVTNAQQTTRALPLMPATPVSPTAQINPDESPTLNTPASISDEAPAKDVTEGHAVNAYALRQPDIQTRPITNIEKPLPLPAQTNTATTITESPTPEPSKSDILHSDNNAATASPPVEPTSGEKPEAKPVATTAPLKTVVTKPAASVVAKSSPADWLGSQNPRHFTLQIMGSHEHASISKVLRAHKLEPDKAGIVHTRLNNKDWFILVYGSYSSRDKARAAVNTLPKGLQITKPWPRLIGDIKQVK